MVEALAIDRTEEALGDGIILAMSYTTHAGLHPMTPERCAVVAARVRTGIKESPQHFLVGATAR
jgi:hypothetical protein